MKVELKKKEYKVNWHHDVDNQRTQCIVADAKGELIGAGVSKVGPKDQYCRNIGRKVSMTRALQVIAKEDRKTFWDAYHKQSQPELLK